MHAGSDDGVLLGHWTEPEGRSGCTVVVFPEGSVASGEIRGGAPATREFGLLDPRRMVGQVDAVVLSGGSAFGLAAADGVIEGLAERDRGFETRAGRVPIVVGMSLFDLADGVPRPDRSAGRAALDTASNGPWPTGRYGAGAGATIGKWRGSDHRVDAGIGISTVRSGEVTVTAIMAVNAVGDLDDGATAQEIIDGTFLPPTIEPESFENTTIGVVWTNATLTKVECRTIAEGGHDGMGRALLPAHTQADGDAIVAVATNVIETGAPEASVANIRLLATVAVEQAIRGCRGDE
ncbi:MAG: P1 family peptidase [Actinomycetota bacterium]